MLCLSTEFCVKRTHLQHAGVKAICKIASIDDDFLEAYVYFVASGMDVFDN
jgi:hypothetical protein